MNYYNPPHEVKDNEKLQSMIETLESGGSLPPVVVHGCDAYTGSHRIAAWDACEVEPVVIEMSDEDHILATAGMNGCDDLNPDDPDDLEFFYAHLNTDICDYNEFCTALLRHSKNDDIREAVKDQV